MKDRQRSTVFWILFIIIVAAIFVILAFPNYGTLSILSKKFSITEARNLAANLTASSAANYTLRKANPSKGIAIRNCKDLANFQGNTLPKGYQITDQTIKPDTVTFCVLNGPGITAIEFSAIGIS